MDADLTRSTLLAGELQGPDHPEAGKFMTYGRTQNEAVSDYAANGAAHNVILTERVSADLVLVHQSRVAAFYRRLGESPVLAITPRSIKEQVLRCEQPLRARAVQNPPVVAPPLIAAVVPPTAVDDTSPFGLVSFGPGGFGA